MWQAETLSCVELNVHISQSFCSWCLAKLSESPAPNPALFPLILNALRILTREQSGIEEILLSDSLKILLKLAQLCSVEEPQQLSQLDRDSKWV